MEKYFGLSETIKGVEEEKGYNLYTDLEFFTSKKPCKIKILDNVFIVITGEKLLLFYLENFIIKIKIYF